MDCNCGRLMIGSHATNTLNWNPDCHRHGTESAWWNSPEQVEKRSQENEHLRTLQAEARRRRAEAT